MLVILAAVAALLCVMPTSGAPIPRAARLSTSYAKISGPILSPYYVYFGNDESVRLADAFDAPGVKTATIGFATAIPGQCNLTSDLDSLVGDAHAFLQAGGAHAVSFGGFIDASSASNAHVQQACTDPTALADLIANTLATFGTTNAEFDIEGDQLMPDTAAAQRLAAALALVKQRVPALHVTYTLAATPQGLPATGLAQVQALKDAGVELDVLSLMTMDMGVPDVLGASISAIFQGSGQLESVYGLPGGAGMRRMGVIPMIGKDDQGAELNLADAQSLAQFALTNGMKYVSFWAFNRDFPGTDSTTSSVSPDQTVPYQFFGTMAAILSRTGDA